MVRSLGRAFLAIICSKHESWSRMGSYAVEELGSVGEETLVAANVNGSVKEGSGGLGAAQINTIEEHADRIFGRCATLHHVLRPDRDGVFVKMPLFTVCHLEKIQSGDVGCVLGGGTRGVRLPSGPGGGATD